MTIDPTTGRIAWSPAADDIGTHGVTVRVEDGRGGWAEQRYVVSVINAPPNRPPYFTSVPVVEAYVNTPYRYDSDAIDPDDDPLTYTIIAGPEGHVNRSWTGLVSWDPSPTSFPRPPELVVPGLPRVPGFDVQVYAEVPDPVGISFDPTANSCRQQSERREDPPYLGPGPHCRGLRPGCPAGP